jgi:hypothetical protein
MPKYKRLPKNEWKLISDKLSKRAKRGWEIRHEIMKNGEVDADTLRWRHLNDRKGKRCASLCDPDFNVDVSIHHSKRRSDSYDVFKGSDLVCSGGRAKVGLYLGSLLP